MKHFIEIKHRYSGAALWSGQVEAPTDTPFGKLLCLAVIQAIKSSANLSSANLSSANLSGANLYGADLSGANLSGANLRGADLRGADLGGANLYGANLDGANLDGANLRGANLYGANLDGANLDGANLRGANLDGAYLGGLKIVARVHRGDYEFFIWSSVLGGHIIRAGCRTFTLAEFRAHVATEYPGTNKAKETVAILDYLESRLNKFLEV